MNTFTDLIFNAEIYYVDENLSLRTLNPIAARCGYFELIDDTYVLRINYSIDDPSYLKGYPLGDNGFYITLEAPQSNLNFTLLVSNTMTPSYLKSTIGDDDNAKTIPIMARVSTISADYTLGFLEMDLTQIRHSWYIKTTRITVPREIGDLWFRRYMMNRLQCASVVSEQ